MNKHEDHVNTHGNEVCQVHAVKMSGHISGSEADDCASIQSSSHASESSYTETVRMLTLRV